MAERREVTLLGGPLDGMAFLAACEDDGGAYMIVPGESSRAVYEPDDDPDVWLYRGLIG